MWITRYLPRKSSVGSCERVRKSAIACFVTPGTVEISSKFCISSDFVSTGKSPGTQRSTSIFRSVDDPAVVRRALANVAREAAEFLELPGFEVGAAELQCAPYLARLRNPADDFP